MGRNESIYLGMRITKVPNEFIDGGGIADGANKFPGSTLSSHNYEGEMQDIAILPGRGKQMRGHITHEEQFALMSELCKLMRIARISRHGALYGASISAQTFEAAG